MGGLFSHEYVTGPFNGTGITVTVALANTSATDTVAGITTQPGQNPGDGVTVPALTILTYTLDLSGGKAPIQGWVRILTQIGVQLDPLTQIRPRLQDMLDDGNASQSVIDDVSGKLAQSYANLQIPVLLDAYQLGQLLGAAEAFATTNANSNRLAIGEFAKQAADLADSLSNDTPLSVPLNLSDVPGSLRTIASQEATAAFNDLHNSLLFVRGKCQGIFDVTGPENF